MLRLYNGVTIHPLRRRQAITPNTDKPDMMLTALRNEPIDRILPNEPIEPIEKIDPTEPIDMNEFLQPIHKNELVEAMLHLDVIGLVMMVIPLSRPVRHPHVLPLHGLAQKFAVRQG